MKAKLLISSLLLGIAILALAKNEDPVLMTINGKDVRLSEFEYLYNKNNQQQIEKEPLDKYVELFVLYKQKVADAEAAGIDTTQAFIKEFEVYQKQLAAPYLTEDTTYLWQMINETYDRYKKELDIDHIMLPLGTNDAVNAQRIAMLDSLRNCVIAGEDWTALADRYSTDPYKQRNHGHLQDDRARDAIQEHALDNKFYAAVKEAVKVNEKSISVEDFRKLYEKDEK